MTGGGTAASRGRSNRRQGDITERLILDLIRKFFPHAARTRVAQPGADLVASAVGGRVIESTRVPWDRVWLKIRQAADAAADARLPEHWVIKHTPGRGGKPPQFYAITDAEIALAMMRELDELRAAARSGREER